MHGERGLIKWWEREKEDTQKKNDKKETNPPKILHRIHLVNRFSLSLFLQFAFDDFPFETIFIRPMSSTICSISKCAMCNFRRRKSSCCPKRNLNFMQNRKMHVKSWTQRFQCSIIAILSQTFYLLLWFWTTMDTGHTHTTNGKGEGCVCGYWK